MSDIKMLGKWLFVRLIEDKQEGKVIVPDTAKEVTQKGKVLFCKDSTEKVHKNDIVLFKKRAAAAGWRMIELDGEKLMPIKEDEVLALMNGDTAADIQALGDTVFLEWEMAPDIYEGTGLVRPDAYKLMHFTGIVLSKGPNVNKDESASDIRVGDRVFFDQFCGIEKMQEDGKRFGFVKSWDVYCTGVPSREEMLANASLRRGA